MRKLLGYVAVGAVLLTGCTIGQEEAARSGASPPSQAAAQAERCAGRIMTIYYGDALNSGNAGGPDAVRMQKTVALLESDCAANASACVPVVVAAGIAQAPPRGRADAVAAFRRTTACTR